MFVYRITWAPWCKVIIYFVNSIQVYIYINYMEYSFRMVIRIQWVLGGKVFCDNAFEKNAMKKCPLTEMPCVENVFWQIMSLKIMPLLKMPGHQKCPYYKWSSDQNTSMNDKKWFHRKCHFYNASKWKMQYTEKMPFAINNLIAKCFWETNLI